jgi:folate-binding protein YgfZ
MSPAWHGFLEQSGARLLAGLVADFGDPQAERAAAAEGNVLADLSHLAVLAFSGEDAQAFLQGQLTCDLTAIRAGSAMLGAYCSPKGRMLADFFLARGEDRFVMLLPRTLAAAIEKRLRMFVLRSRVHVAPGNEVLLGAAGPRAADALRGLSTADGSMVLEVPGGRFIAVIAPEAAPGVWKSLRAKLRPVGTSCWEWLDIRAGIPMIPPAMQDRLVPQMANLELLGGVSFNKGCYTGQEVVARSQYLGKVKRRMYLARLSGEPAPPQAGDELFSDDLGDQACGWVINAQPSPGSGYDLLAVVPVASREHSTVHLKSPQGEKLSFQPLPYEVK